VEPVVEEVETTLTSEGARHCPASAHCWVREHHVPVEHLQGGGTDSDLYISAASS
jgi:hypothetical protein